MAESLAGRNAIVTGASQGIGLAVAAALIDAGVRTWMIARGEEQLERASEPLGPLARPYPCDVTNAQRVRAMIASISEACGDVPHVLVNNAGLFPLGAIEATSLEQFSAVVDVNLTAPFHLLRALLPGMRARGSGHIVSIGSISDRHVFAGNSSYSATKYGARALHEVLRLETRGSGVRATLIAPAATDTPIWDPVDPDNRPGFPRRADMLRPEAVADAVLWAVTRPASVNVDELRLSSS